MATVKTRSKRKTEELEENSAVASTAGSENDVKPDVPAPAAPNKRVKRAEYSIQWNDDGTVAVELNGAAFKLSSRRLSKESDYFRDKFAKGTELTDENGLSLYVIDEEEIEVEIIDFTALLKMMDDAM